MKTRPGFSDRYLRRHRLRGRLVWVQRGTGRLRVRRVRRQVFPDLGIIIWLECSWAGRPFRKRDFDRFGGIWIRSTDICRKEDRFPALHQ